VAASSLGPGDLVHDRYSLTRAVGTSEGSVVFLAEDTTLQRPVAVRVLTDAALADPAWREYVRRETTAVAALHHPNLTRIYDWGEERGDLYVVTEYLAGGSLRDILAARGRLSAEQTALIGLEAATALAYAHAREFLHGALRPSKILFDEEGRVRVNGLGLDSSLAATRGQSTRSLEDAVYLSPEQVTGATLEGRSDVYTLALILYECLTGHPAHTGRTLEAIRTSRLGTPLPSRPELGPLDLPLALAAAPEPAARPDADLFANRLASVAATLPVPRPVTLSATNTGGFRVPTPEDVLRAPAVAISGRTLSSGESELVRPLDLPGYREQFEGIAAAQHRAPERPGRGVVAVALLVGIGLIATGVGLGVAWKVGAFTPTYAVPNITHETPSAALAALARDDFSIRIVDSQQSN
jgi:eukaryotic-like serine/threonine-protein kinase